MGVEETGQALREMEAGLGTVLRPAYQLRGAKEFALDLGGNAGPGGCVWGRAGTGRSKARGVRWVESVDGDLVSTMPAGEHGVEWGEAVHRLLDIAMRNPKADLLRLAGRILQEHDWTGIVPRKLWGTVRAVTKSEIWRRAMRSPKRYSEIPFQILMAEEDGMDVPTVVRGVIDLVFFEDDGWVIVDYKTDKLRSNDPCALVEKYAAQVRLYALAWKKCTGQIAKAVGLYFLRR